MHKEHASRCSAARTGAVVVIVKRTCVVRAAFADLRRAKRTRAQWRTIVGNGKRTLLGNAPPRAARRGHK